MKTYHFAAAAASVLAFAVAAPAFAQSGFVTGLAGEVHDSNSSTTDQGYGIEGAYSTSLGGFDLQVDGGYVDTNASGTDTDAVVGAATLLTRTDTRGYGATVTLGDVFGSDLLEGSVFVQGYLEKATLTARAGYGTIDTGASDISYYDVNMGGSFFMTDNFALNVNANFNDQEGSVSVLSGNIGFEYKVASSPIGVVGGYGFNTNGTILSIGIRGNFGADTLRQRTQQGPVSSGIVTGRLFRY